MDEYLFVYDGRSWWLKLTTTEQLIDYHKQTSNRYEGAVRLCLKFRQEGKELYDVLEELPLPERITLMQDKDFKYLQCAVIKAQQVEGTIFDGFRCLNMEAGQNELEVIKEHGAVFLNPAGGHTWGVETVQFCRRKSLIFPHFRQEDIRLAQFPGGRHWYAYVGDVQVRNGGRQKWNTREEARTAAEAMVATESAPG